ncbi:MAG: peptidylprolyl isomerase [Alteromonadaceae bacterium]|nr:peptidylprolyl isomerase [Alteromonadaceae bacterium]
MKLKIFFIAVIAAGGLLATTICNAQDELTTQWRKLDPDNTVLMTLPHGKVVIELAPQFSPKHVAQFSKLVKEGFYDKTKFYRVIDGFVAQAGPEDESEKDKSVPTLKIEEEWNTDKNWSFTKVQDNDLFAEQTGFKDGFAVATNPSENKAWLTHCPGILAMARSSTPDSGSSHFYIPNGQAPRYLDRIMTIFGRVVYGMNHIQAIQRTAVIDGEPEVAEKDHTQILKMQLMSNVPKQQKIIIEVESTQGKAFETGLAKRRARENEFFYKKPPPVLDVCQVPVRSRLVNLISSN